MMRPVRVTTFMRDIQNSNSPKNLTPSRLIAKIAIMTIVTQMAGLSGRAENVRERLYRQAGKKARKRPKNVHFFWWSQY